MVATLPKRHLVAVTQKASAFHLLVFYTLWTYLGGEELRIEYSVITVRQNS